MRKTISKAQTISGRRFSKKDLLLIQETVELFPNISRTEIAKTICEHLSWVTSKGNNKINSCKKVLEKLEVHGFIQLPPKQVRKKRVLKKVQCTDNSAPGPQIECSLDDLSPIELRLVKDKNEVALWNEYVERYHYLGYKHPIGDTLRYFIVSKPTDQLLGCIMFSSAVWALADREKWIGWSTKDREKRLKFVINNNRFLIFPWIKVENLASKALSMAIKRIRKDWKQEFKFQPVLIETFVDPNHYLGTCYQASNWQNIGKTSGKSRNNKDEDISRKMIFVYELNPNFKAILMNQKIATQKVQFKIDEEFVQLWGKVVGTIAEVAYDFDKKWQKRKRTIDSLLLVFLIFRLIYSKNNQGYGTTIYDFWDHCRKANFPLPQNRPISASAFTVARSKLDEYIFIDLNKKIISLYEEDTNDIQCRIKGHRVFAVDGSKMDLPRTLIEKGYDTPSNSSHYPQGLVSCLYQLKSKIPYDFDLVNHGDERACALSHLKALKKDDIVVYDRGYFSYAMLYFHVQLGINPVFRLRNGANAAIDKFRLSDKVDQIITLNPTGATKAHIKKTFSEIKITPLKLRLVKYKIAETTYCIGTTLLDPKFDINTIKEMYHSRWGIEELYKISKDFMEVDEFHGKSERSVKQELFAHFLLITLNRICSNESENMIEELFNPLNKKDNDTQTIKVNFKNCLTTVSRHLEEFMMVPIQSVKKVLDNVIESICRQRYKIRPNRSYQRKSMKPANKWKKDKSKKESQVVLV